MWSTNRKAFRPLENTIFHNRFYEKHKHQIIFYYNANIHKLMKSSIGGTCGTNTNGADSWAICGENIDLIKRSFTNSITKCKREI